MTSVSSQSGVDVAVRLSPEAVRQIRELIGLGLAASLEHYVADSVRNRLAGYQDAGIGQLDGDPRDWVVPAPR